MHTILIITIGDIITATTCSSHTGEHMSSFPIGARVCAGNRAAVGCVSALPLAREGGEGGGVADFFKGGGRTGSSFVTTPWGGAEGGRAGWVTAGGLTLEALNRGASAVRME